MASAIQRYPSSVRWIESLADPAGSAGRLPEHNAPAEQRHQEQNVDDWTMADHPGQQHRASDERGMQETQGERHMEAIAELAMSSAEGSEIERDGGQQRHEEPEKRGHSYEVFTGVTARRGVDPV
jgi:hypothetical protein